MMMEPKIRLRGFSGEWNKTTFGAFGNVAMCRRIFKEQTTEQGDIPFYKIGTFGKEPDAFISYDLYDEYKTKYPFPQKGDILISAAGTIGRTVEYRGEDSYFQDSNIVWLNHSNKLDNSFLKQLYSIVKWSSLEGATIQRLYNSNILETEINIPSLPEQRALATFFTSLDNQISAAEKRLASLKQVKAASLQAMFPQEGETTPKLRFKGCEGEWKKVKLGEIFQERNENDIHGEMLSVTMNNGIIKASQNGRFDNSNDDKSKYKVVKVNDIAYNSMRMWQGASGCSSYEGIVSPAYTVLVPMDNVYPVFFSYLFKCDYILKIFRLNSQGLTSDTWNLKYPVLSKIEVYYPSSLTEQRQIASYFTTLDRQITAQSSKISKLKQIKSACLDQMFV